MGNQRRFAAQASEPPHTARNPGRKGNGPKLFLFPPAMAGADIFPHLPYPVVCSANLSVGPSSRSYRLCLEISVADAVRAVFGVTRPTVPALDGGVGSRTHGGLAAWSRLTEPQECAIVIQ